MHKKHHGHAGHKGHHHKEHAKGHGRHSHHHTVGHAPSHGTSEHEGHAEGHGQFANMPQSVTFKPYSKAPHYSGRGLDDTITGIDHCNSHAEHQSNRHISNQH